LLFSGERLHRALLPEDTLNGGIIALSFIPARYPCAHVTLAAVYRRPTVQTSYCAWGCFAKTLRPLPMRQGVGRRATSNSIENPDVPEIGSTPVKPASFASVWFGPDFQAFRQAHLDGNIPAYCRGCYRDGDHQGQYCSGRQKSTPAQALGSFFTDADLRHWRS
jgi:hypothetical protein